MLSGLPESQRKHLQITVSIQQCDMVCAAVQSYVTLNMPFSHTSGFVSNSCCSGPEVSRGPAPCFCRCSVPETVGAAWTPSPSEPQQQGQRPKQQKSQWVPARMSNYLIKQFKITNTTLQLLFYLKINHSSLPVSLGSCSGLLSGLVRGLWPEGLLQRSLQGSRRAISQPLL